MDAKTKEMLTRFSLANASMNAGSNPNWDETKHPRGSDGKFGAGGGGEVATNDDPLDDKQEYAFTMDPRETDPFSDEEAVQFGNRHGVRMSKNSRGDWTFSGNINSMASAYKEISMGDMGSFVDAVKDVADGDEIKNERDAMLYFIRKIANRNKFSKW